MPEDCGSTTLSTKAATTAASIAAPPSSSASIAACVANGLAVTATALPLATETRSPCPLAASGLARSSPQTEAEPNENKRRKNTRPQQNFINENNNLYISRHQETVRAHCATTNPRGIQTYAKSNKNS